MVWLLREKVHPHKHKQKHAICKDDEITMKIKGANQRLRPSP